VKVQGDDGKLPGWVGRGGLARTEEKGFKACDIEGRRRSDNS